MGRNKRDNVAALHEQAIMDAAERVFLKKGFQSTTITDITQASGYSRRTIYAYFENKEEILLNIVLKGLLMLRDEIGAAVGQPSGFIDTYFTICRAMADYYVNSPQSFQAINMADTGGAADMDVPPTARRIYEAGEQINDLLYGFIQSGKRAGLVLEDVKTMPAVYVLWSNISSLMYLAKSKGSFIQQEFAGSIEDFIDYGLRQILNAILVERI